MKKAKRRNPRHEYEVIVGNIGTVYSGRNGFEAHKKYQTYVGQSKSDYGRAAGEDVTLMVDGEPTKEYFGARSRSEENPHGEAFLRGFAKQTGLDLQEAGEQWAAFSRQLSNKEIQRIEGGGYKSGLREGKAFRKMFPSEENPRLPSGLAILRKLAGSTPVSIQLQKVNGKIQLKVPRPSPTLMKRLGLRARMQNPFRAKHVSTSTGPKPYTVLVYSSSTRAYNHLMGGFFPTLKAAHKYIRMLHSRGVLFGRGAQITHLQKVVWEKEY